jgi:hypothetical protein
LYHEYKNGNQIPINKNNPEYKILNMKEVFHVLPLVDMLNLFRKIKHGSKVVQGMINGIPTKIYNIKIHDTKNVNPGTIIGPVKLTIIYIL